jgi:NAD(P)-dependent dehydrogenase (short-subunit alcohol dehydrogenase family)
MGDNLFEIPKPKPLGELLSLEGRTAIVTGGGRGLGKQVVARLAEAGADVVLAARHADQLQAVCDEYAGLPGRLLPVSADVSRMGDIARLAKAAQGEFGGIDILVNCAAIYPPASTLETDEETFDAMVAIDLKGMYFLSQAAARVMVEQGRGGRIVNFLSTAFEDAAPMFSAYAVAKAGVWEATRVMAHELAAHRITVNAVTPGATLTEEKARALATGDVSAALGMKVPDELAGMLKQAAESGAMKQMMKQRIPFGRMGYPDDLACAVLYLASDMASYVTGQNITVRGGQSDTGGASMPLPGMANMRMAAVEPGAGDAAPAADPASSDEADPGLDGTWKATVETPMGKQDIELDLRTDGTALAGTMVFMGKRIDVLEGVATAAGFRYRIQVKAMLKKMEATVTGTRDGDAVRGTVESPMGAFPFEGARA